MRSTGVLLAVAMAGVLIIAGVFAQARGPTVASDLVLASMAESAAAMVTAGSVMQVHGQLMLDQGNATNDADLVAHGEHWLEDGLALVLGGDWMTANPTSPGSLVSDAARLSEGGSWGELNRAAQQMIHDPRGARSVDLEALRWNGQAMRSEGRTMAEHGLVMAEEVELMVNLHRLSDEAASDLRSATQAMIDVGQRLEQNGNEMIDYADRLRHRMGLGD